MAFEIEFFPVGEGSTAGDAITLRYVDLGTGNYRVMVIDGGTDASGEAIVAHIKNVFGEHTVVSDVISTHPDTDHSCGLRAVLRELPVERLWVHALWEHAPQITHLFHDVWTAADLEKEIYEQYPVIGELFELADAQGTQIYEPFAGQVIGPFTVLSPDQGTYQHLIPQFRKTPNADTDALKDLNIWIGAPKGGFLNALAEKASALIENLVKESWYNERLKDGGITAAENESSLVLLGQFGSSRILLTGDAGLNALNWACDNADAWGLPMAPFDLVQVPHHGSRRNVSPAILNRLIGPILLEGSVETQKAIASVPKDDSKHPRKMVTNAFMRRGAGVRTTQGQKYRFHDNMPTREGETPAKPLGFYTDVEDYD